jgi:hypothetical protein
MSDLLEPITVSDIVKDLLEYKFEAATILLNAEAQANAFNKKTMLPPAWVPKIKQENIITWTINLNNPDVPYWYTTRT